MSGSNKLKQSKRPFPTKGIFLPNPDGWEFPILLSVETVLQLPLHRPPAPGVPTAAATADGLAGAAFAGTKGVPAFEETDMDQAFTSSLFNQKLSQTPPKIVKVSHAKNSLGISWFQQWPSQAYEQYEACGTKTHQASSCWATLGTEWHEGFS